MTPAQIAEDSERDPMIRRAIEFGRKRRAQNFSDLRDLEISNSVNSGEYRVQLWASGRITYTKVSRQAPKPERVSPNLTMAQIAPPHDFLRDSSHPEVGVEAVPEPLVEEAR